MLVYAYKQNGETQRIKWLQILPEPVLYQATKDNNEGIYSQILATIRTVTRCEYPLPQEPI